MENRDEYVGKLLSVWLEVRDNGLGVTGLSPVVTIKNMTGGTYWNGTIWTTYNRPSMIEYDAAKYPGLYFYAFTMSSAEDDYLIRKENTGTYACDDYEIVRGRKKPLDMARSTRTSTSPAASTYGDTLEEIHGATAGNKQLGNTGTGGRIKQSIKNYANANVILEQDITKTNGDPNTQTLDANAMAGSKPAA